MQENLEALGKTAQDELVAASVSGDGTAFELLASRFKNYINSYISTLNVSPHERDDLYQEGLIGLLKAVKSYDYESSSFSTYASVCIKSSIISALRKLNRNSRFELSANPEIDFTQNISTPSHEASVIQSSVISQGYDAFIHDLSPFERRVFRLYIQGWSYARMANELSKSEKSIDNALTRIKTKLKRRFK